MSTSSALTSGPLNIALNVWSQPFADDAGDRIGPPDQARGLQ
jgi:hypothetical protein